MSDELNDDVIQEAEALEVAWREACADSMMAFANGLNMPGVSGPEIFGGIMADFQRDFFEDIAPNIEALRANAMPEKRRWYLERTKKSSKDSDLAVIICWLVAFTDRPLLIQVCAASGEQASIIENRARDLLHYNPWLGEHLEVIERKIRSRKFPSTTVCQIESTGSAGAAQGPTPDLLILNEMVHVDKWSVLEAHLNNADGVPRGIVIMSTNAGILGSPAWAWREAVLDDPVRWTCHIWSKMAPWLNEADIEDARKRDVIGTEFLRLWTGKWVSGTGDAVGEDVLKAAFKMNGPVQRPENDWHYLIGLDLGISHDHAGAAVIGVHPRQQRVQTCLVRGWAPSKVMNEQGKLEVDLQNVEDTVRRWAKVYGVRSLHYDPAAGGSFMAQRLRSSGVICLEQPFKASGMTAMAESFVTLLKGGLLECYHDDEGRLMRDFGKFSIEHKPPSSYKLVSIRDSSGHADVGTAVIVALPTAVDLLGGIAGLLRGDVVASFMDNKDLDKEEIKQLPDEFKELWEMYDNMPDKNQSEWDY